MSTRLLSLIEAPGDVELWSLVAVDGHEELSGLFNFTLDMVTNGTAPTEADFLSQSVTFGVGAEAKTRRSVNGQVIGFTLLDNTGEKCAVRLLLAPAFWQTTLRSDCRIFQNKSAVDIIKDVLGEYPDITSKFNVTKTAVVREYCVQYRESDFNFICRLLEEEGIYYFFDHTQGSGKFQHTLVFSDSSSSYFDSPESPVRVDVQAQGIRSINRLGLSFNALATSTTLRDYNYKETTNTLEAAEFAAHAWADSHSKRFDFPQSYAARDTGKKYAHVAMQREEVGTAVAAGGSDCHFMCPGMRIALDEGASDPRFKEIVLVAVTHTVVDPVETASLRGYSNSFRAIPSSATYVPPRRAELGIVRGPHSAIVVGESTSDDILVDDLGRVKVQFYWDRQGKNDDKSSCWLRVVQSWAGPNYGAQFIPRVGMEVLVDFIEGNPDRPIVVGCVYNGTNKPTFAKDKKTQSGWRGQSSPKGSKHNEFWFEDKKDSEEVFLHAAKDLKVTVDNDETDKIKNNREVTIESGNEKLTVSSGKRTVEISAGSDSLKAGTTITIEANQSIELKVGTSSLKLEPAKISMKSTMIEIEATGMLKNKAPMVQVNGDGTVIIKGGIVLIN